MRGWGCQPCNHGKRMQTRSQLLNGFALCHPSSGESPKLRPSMDAILFECQFMREGSASSFKMFYAHIWSGKPWNSKLASWSGKQSHSI